jgi:hypothetical protein
MVFFVKGLTPYTILLCSVDKGCSRRVHIIVLNIKLIRKTVYTCIQQDQRLHVGESAQDV